MVTQKSTLKSFNSDVSHLYLFSAKEVKRQIDQNQELPLRLEECNYHRLESQFKEIILMNRGSHHERDQDLDPLRQEESQILEDEQLSCKSRIVNPKSVQAASIIWKIQEGFLNIRHHKLIVHLPE
jgi:hypothetical protein